MTESMVACPSVLLSVLVVFAFTTSVGHGQSAPAENPQGALPPSSVTEGVVSLSSGKTVAYLATAGFLTVGATEAQDETIGPDGGGAPGSSAKLTANEETQPAKARMYYTAYFAKDADRRTRPLLFIYDGGPGASTAPLLMTSFGPMQVALPDLQHQVGGPYRVTNNPDSLLDVADLVFIDAPGAGYSRVLGRDAAQAFYGVDEDAGAFDRFIKRFLNKYARWESPKFLVGHSYGTQRSAALAWQLLQDGIAVNGIVSISQYLSLSDMLDAESGNVGTENGYFLALPTYAALAWFHHRVPSQPAQLLPWLHEVEHYALNDYASALLAGADLPPETEQAVAARLAAFTGIPAATWVRADLRIKGSEFRKILLEDAAMTIGRLDGRYVGPALDPMAGDAGYDPSSVGSSIIAAMNSYTQDVLKTGVAMTYESVADVPGLRWDFFHVATDQSWLGLDNVMPDLADAMIRNTKMHVLLMGGYFDLGTTYFGAIYEMKHLRIPKSLQRNIEYQFYPAGHSPYVNEDSRIQMHASMAQFIEAGAGRD